MAKFCPNCGNPIDEGATFCDNCGARVDAPPKAQPAQAPTPQHTQPAQQYSPAQPYTPQQPYQPNQPAPQFGAPQPPKKKKGLMIALISAGVALAVIAIVVIFVIVKPHKQPDTPPTNSGEYSASETVDKSEPTSEPQTEAPTEALTEQPTVAPTEAPTEAPAKLPYVDSIGEPSATDFTWISDAQGGSLSGSFLGIDDLVGKWKGEIIYEGAWELVYVTIDRDAKITIQPYQINYGDGWQDESGEEPYVFDGAFDISSVNGAGSYGSINLYTFLESNGTQYSVGTFSVNNTSSADVYLVRP